MMTNNYITALIIFGMIYLLSRIFRLYHIRKHTAFQQQMHEILHSKKFKVKGRFH